MLQPTRFLWEMLAEHEESKPNPALSKLLRKQWPRTKHTSFPWTPVENGPLWRLEDGAR